MKKGAWLAGAALCVALGAARFWDLSHWFDPATGFVTAGTVWIRLFALGAVVALILLFSLTLSGGGVPLPRGGGVLAPYAFFAGAVMAGYGLYALAAYLLSGIYLQAVLGLWCALCGVWLVTLGVWCVESERKTPFFGVLAGAGCTGYFYLLLILRFVQRPSSLHRLGPTGEILSALAMMLLSTVLLRGMYAEKEPPAGRRSFAVGMLAFLFCFCLTAPEVAYALLIQKSGSISILEKLCECVVGLLGLALSYCAAAQKAPARRDGRRVYRRAEG